MTIPEAVLVTGATGYVGPRVVNALHAAGCRVRTFSLDVAPPGMMPEMTEQRVGDITDEIAVGSAMNGMSAVIHLAALLHVTDPPPTLRKEYERVNVRGTATVVEAAASAGVKRVVYFSTIAVYNPLACQIASEDSPTLAGTFYAQTKLAAEKLVLGDFVRAGASNGTVLRFGAVYGSRVKGNYRQLVQALARNRFVPVGNGLNRRSLIYDKDAARAVLLAVSHPAAVGKVFNVTDGQFHTMKEIISAICHALGRKPPRLSLPLGPARVAAGILDLAARSFGHRLAMRTRLNKYTEDVAVSCNRIQSELGFVPEFDLAAGWNESIAEMREMRIV
jgi:nucleoside-diphosphate-sugar epimerase